MADKIHATLSSLGCVVKATFPGVKDECSTCGIILHPEEGIILSHGSIFTELCQSNDTLLKKIKAGQVISNSDLDGHTFSALMNKCWTPVNVTDQQVQNSFSHAKCRLLGAFRNFEFHNAVCKTMPEDNWSFANASQEDSVSPAGSKSTTSESDGLDIDNNILFHLLSYFVLLKCESLVYHGDVSLSPLMGSVLSQSPVRREICTIGSDAEIISTPFAGLNPSVFFNSYSKGIISNVSGANNSWILTDARCIPGSEGGPLFTVRSDGTRQLAGMVVASLCWKNKEWVGLSLVCGMDSIFKIATSNILKAVSSLDWQNFENIDSAFSSSKDHLREKRILPNGKGQEHPDFLPSVVLVKVGKVWGSGFIVDARSGLILTCSHVIKDASPHDPPILIKAHGSSKLHKASVIYRQDSGEINPFDLAVLRCPEATRCVRTSVSQPNVVSPLIGERVWVCGHAVFSSDLGLQPSASAGVISKVVQVRGQDIMVQSTCAVHAGASGGPMLDTHGNLVGIVVCNTVDKGSNSTYPHVNFSIPAITVWPCVQPYIKTGDASLMKTLKINDSLVKKIWALDSSLESDFALKSKL